MKEHIDLNGKTILVSGSPGFIVATLVIRLLSEMTSGTIISLDNVNNYYDHHMLHHQQYGLEQAFGPAMIL